jgi:hypothetical protein
MPKIMTNSEESGDSESFTKSRTGRNSASAVTAGIDINQNLQKKFPMPESRSVCDAVNELLDYVRAKDATKLSGCEWHIRGPILRAFAGEPETSEFKLRASGPIASNMLIASLPVKLSERIAEENPNYVSMDLMQGEELLHGSVEVLLSETGVKATRILVPVDMEYSAVSTDGTSLGTGWLMKTLENRAEAQKSEPISFESEPDETDD